jgi:hypothetical protein
MDRTLADRIAENEDLARHVNEAIERGQWPGEDDDTSAFRCECARLDCNRLIELTPREYEHIRAHPRRFVVIEGHQRPDFETVLEATRDYLVVQKRDEAGAAAEETDPRG